MSLANSSNHIEPPNILVLGSNGFIGQNLVVQLSETANVFGYGRSSAPDPRCKSYLQRDFSLDLELREILEDLRIDTVYHLISATVPTEGGQHAQEEIQKVVLPTLRLLEAMKETNTGKIVFVSSGGTVYGENGGHPSKTEDPVHPICSYGIHKVMIEQYLELYRRCHGLQSVAVRLGNPYGLKERGNVSQGIIPIFLERLLNGMPITLYGETTRDYIYIDDAVDALVKVGVYAGSQRIFNVGTGVSTSLHELIQLMENISCKKFSQIIEQPIRSCDVKGNCLDIEKTKIELGWTPTVDLIEGIQKVVHQMQECD